MPTGTGPGSPASCCQRLQCAHRLTVRIFEVAHAVAVRGVARARQRDVVLVAAAHAQALLGEVELAAGRVDHVLCDRLLQPRFRGEEPALRRQRRQRLSRVFGVEGGGTVLRAGRCAARAHAAPDVELPVGENAAALQAARVAGKRAAAARERVHLRIERRPGELDVAGRLLDASRRHAQIRVVLERLAHQRIELRIVERPQPAARHAACWRAGFGPGLGRLEVRRRVVHQVLALGGRLERTTGGDEEHEDREQRSHQCSLRTR